MLVVEDEPSIRALLVALLTTAGYEVLEAEEGEAALRLASARAPDLITLDLMLPRMSGHDVLAALAADPRTRAIPVVVVSASTRTLQPTPQVRAVVAKPFDPQDLLDAIAQVLGAA